MKKDIEYLGKGTAMEDIKKGQSVVFLMKESNGDTRVFRLGGKLIERAIKNNHKKQNGKNIRGSKPKTSR